MLYIWNPTPSYYSLASLQPIRGSFRRIFSASGELVGQLGILYGEGVIVIIHIGDGKPIRIKCFMPTPGTIKAQNSSEAYLKCQLNLSEADYRG